MKGCLRIVLKNFFFNIENYCGNLSRKKKKKPQENYGAVESTQKAILHTF